MYYLLIGIPAGKGLPASSVEKKLLETCKKRISWMSTYPDVVFSGFQYPQTSLIQQVGALTAHR
jgi:hypothetical protein